MFMRVRMASDGRCCQTAMKAVFWEEGMLTSDEPGVYLTGKFGIRRENLMVCMKGEKNEYGQFMYFDTVTLVPF